METTTQTAQNGAQAATAGPTPEHIMQIGMGFWASKTLLTAVKFKLFTVLAKGSRTGEQIRTELGLNQRSLYDFLDTLVALGFLERTGLKETAVYSNAADSDFFLDKSKPTYLGGILEMSNDRLYRYWDTLEDGLITGKPQSELKYANSENYFNEVYATPESLSEFMNAMAGVQMGGFMAFAKKFDFGKYKTMCDAGGANGSLSAQVALNQPHMTCITFDLPVVEPIAKKTISRFNLTGRVEAKSGDFFKDAMPTADVITMGNILHDWDAAEKLHLMKLAYNSLPAGGAFVCIENIIDNDRRKNAFGLMMSLNMLIETKAGYDFSFSDFEELAKQAGFTKTELLPLAGPTSAAIAYK